MTGPQALRCAAAVVARSVPDLPGLLDLLDLAGQRRLAAAVRAELAERPPVVVGGSSAPRPDPRVWGEAADRLIGGGRP